MDREKVKSWAQEVALASKGIFDRFHSVYGNDYPLIAIQACELAAIYGVASENGLSQADMEEFAQEIKIMMNEEKEK